MKLSFHTLIVDDYPKKGDHLLYNTRTQAMVKIDSAFKNIIENLDVTPSKLKKSRRVEISALHEMGILVRDQEEDLRRLKDHMMSLKHDYIDASLVITILTTYACNLKCVYCFQESSRTNEKMKPETANFSIDWIKEKLLKSGNKKLLLNFYGGEPLVNKPTLEYMVNQLKPWCELQGVNFGFMIQTNGYLMTSQLIGRYKLMGLEQVRISVDGVGEDHDRNRPLRKGGGTFDKIMKNIRDCVDQIPIGISVSYDKGETDHIERLLDYFNDLGILHKLGRFIFSPIHPTLGPKDKPELIQNPSCNCNYDNQVLADANKKIEKLMKDRGLSTNNGLSTFTCPLTRENSGGTIDQKGDIYKCNSMLGHPELSVGNVKDNSYNAKHEEFVNLDVWKQCPVDCSFMPMCSGGCRLSSFLKNLNFKTPSCHKPFLYKMTPIFIKKEYDKLMANKA